jgi:hypothetical protein
VKKTPKEIELEEIKLAVETEAENSPDLPAEQS